MPLFLLIIWRNPSCQQYCCTVFITFPFFYPQTNFIHNSQILNKTSLKSKSDIVSSVIACAIGRAHLIAWPMRPMENNMKINFLQKIGSLNHQG